MNKNVKDINLVKSFDNAIEAVGNLIGDLIALDKVSDPLFHSLNEMIHILTSEKKKLAKEEEKKAA